MWFEVLWLTLAFSSCTRAVWHEDAGPWFIATKGELFPRARVRTVTPDFLIVRPSIFQFRVVGKTCDIIEEAMDRYTSIMITDARIAVKAALPTPETFVRQSPNFRGDLLALEINLKNECEKYPYLGMHEDYSLAIDAETKIGRLAARDVWGILRGLESFSQLISASTDGHLTIKGQDVYDEPRFPHRGLLLDTSRHYFPLSDILLILDAMSYNKLNVFHWHIVDDNSFPYVSRAYPKLSEMGAYHPSMVYTPSNVRKVVEYGRLRGIRVIAEFDTPAHARSWGQAHPEILTECYKNGNLTGKYGPMNPSKPELYKFLETIFGEAFELFPDRYVHLGGDEIPFDCWGSNPDVIEYMRAKGYKEGDFKALESEYFAKLLEIPKKANVSSIVWQEVYLNVASLPAETVVQVWDGEWRKLMQDVVAKNHSAILSACWYLSDIKAGGDWTKFYLCDPTSFVATPEMKARVIGGETCMWGEFVDTMNVHQRIWPRASAAAERLWSHHIQTTNEVAKRLEEHSCRMNRRGIPAQPPNGSGFCIL